MKTTTSMVLTGVIALGATWAKKTTPFLKSGSQDTKDIPEVGIKVWVGLAIITLGLAGLSEVNRKFAEQLGLLILVAAVLIYGLPLFQMLGPYGNSAYNQPRKLGR